MNLVRRGYSGLDYLQEVTAFMLQCRREAPLAGMWDAADVQWWWRDDVYRDPNQQMFFEDERGRTLGFILLSSAHNTFDYELLPGLEREQAREIFGWGLDELEQIEQRNARSASVFVKAEHLMFRDMVERAGFNKTATAYVQTALELDGSLPSVPTPKGYRVRSLLTSDLVQGAPPVLRISAEKYARVSATPLYQLDLHLVVTAPGPTIAAECIGWLDAESGVGVFEPVRTDEAYQQQGLAKALMAQGLKRMQALGVKWAKVSHQRSNPAAASLYGSLGFEKTFERLVYTR